MSNLLARRETQFVLWSPTEPTNAPKLVLGRIQNGNPAKFQEILR
jgi:hypothetical protein